MDKVFQEGYNKFIFRPDGIEIFSKPSSRYFIFFVGCCGLGFLFFVEQLSFGSSAVMICILLLLLSFFLGSMKESININFVEGVLLCCNSTLFSSAEEVCPLANAKSFKVFYRMVGENNDREDWKVAIDFEDGKSFVLNHSLSKKQAEHQMQYLEILFKQHGFLAKNEVCGGDHNE